MLRQPFLLWATSFPPALIWSNEWLQKATLWEITPIITLICQNVNHGVLSKEIQDLEKLYQDTVGQPLTKFYRPPQGKYSESNLKMAQELGYKTFFWSLVYVDWYQDKQPTKEEAFKNSLAESIREPLFSCTAPRKRMLTLWMNS